MRNGFIWGAIVFCIGLLGVAMYWPPAASLLSLGPLTGRPLTLAIGCSLLPLLAGFVVRGIGVQLRPGASTISPVPPNWRARQVVSGCASEIAASVTD
ncbi:MAG: hypothetical protein GY811_14420 [Myxococcales bacterium]|nr:hypothetical protein [Myxococcales bacterium]